MTDIYYRLRDGVMKKIRSIEIEERLFTVEIMLIFYDIVPPVKLSLDKSAGGEVIRRHITRVGGR